MSHEIAELLITQEAVLLRPNEPFTFASGIKSPIYCDNRLLLSEPKTRKKVLEGFLMLTDSFRFEAIAGVATAGIAWGAWLAERLNSNFAYVRGAAKEHGKKNQIEGKLKPGSRVLLVEDLISTGGSVINAAYSLQQAGMFVSGIASIFSYGFDETLKAFADKNIEVKSMVLFSDLLSVAKTLKKITPAEETLILRWQKNPRTY